MRYTLLLRLLSALNYGPFHPLCQKFFYFNLPRLVFVRQYQVPGLQLLYHIEWSDYSWHCTLQFKPGH